MKLALLAIEVIHGATVIYVPAPNKFLKSWKTMDDDDIFSERERIDMILWKAGTKMSDKFGFVKVLLDLNNVAFATYVIISFKW